MHIAIGEAGTSPIASALSQGLDVELFWILDDITPLEQLSDAVAAEDVHLFDVRPATEEEVQAGSVGEPLFMVQTGAPPDERGR